jgi:hypothetical protein
MVIILNANPEGLSLVGVPGFAVRGSAAVPVSAVLGSNLLTLEWSLPVQPSDVIELGAQDPALRGPQGEYLSPGSIVGGPLAGGLTVLPTVPSFEVVSMNPSVPVNELLVVDPTGWRSVPGGIESFFSVVDGSNWFLSFNADVSGETGIEHYDRWEGNIAINGGRVPLGYYPFNP